MKLASPSAGLGGRVTNQNSNVSQPVPPRSNISFGLLVRDSGDEGKSIVAAGLSRNRTANSEEATFAARTCIGDDAVPFDARPIVAPAQVSAEQVLEQPSHTASAAEVAKTLSPTISETILLSILKDVVERRSAVVSSLATDSKNEHGGNKQTIERGAATRAVSDSAGMATPPSAIGQPGVAALGGTQTPTALSSSVRPMTSSGHHMAARITALPSEVIISLRGLALSSAEREALADEIQAMLKHYQFDDRVIRIVGFGGEK